MFSHCSYLFSDISLYTSIRKSASDRYEYHIYLSIHPKSSDSIFHSSLISPLFPSPPTLNSSPTISTLCFGMSTADLSIGYSSAIWTKTVLSSISIEPGSVENICDPLCRNLSIQSDSISAAGTSGASGQIYSSVAWSYRSSLFHYGIRPENPPSLSL